MVFQGYTISSPYGWRRHPITGEQKFHAGIDLVKSHQAPIYAFTGGVVLFAGMGKSGTGLGGYGNVVVIKDKNNHAQLYAHLDRVSVKTGEQINKNDRIGYQGATGYVTGSHLHYEVRKKTSPQYGWEADASKSTLNPTTYLRNFDSSPSISNSNGQTYTVNKTLNGYLTANDAKLRKNKKATVKPGQYFVFNRSEGMINVTTVKGVPGSWINPNDNR